MSKDVERKLAEIFHSHNVRMEQREREIAAEKKRQFDNVMKMHIHLSKVIMPTLRDLAISIQKTGQRASVVETGPMGSTETSTAQVKITIIPRGYETADPNELPRLLFQSSPSGITVTEFAHFPGSGGQSSTTQAYMPEEMGTEKIEAFLIALVKQTFNR